jgi:hypothetical protein
MAFGLIRVRNLAAADIASTDKHNARRYTSKEHYPDNVPMEKRNDFFINVKYETVSNSEYLDKNETDLAQVIDERLKVNQVKGIKSNSNLAIEYVIGINDLKAWDNYDFNGFVSNSKQWLEDRHGKNSVVAIYSHLDESNPHAHIIVVPIEKKIIKWKNTNGEGEKQENRLNTRDYTGGREKLRTLQDDWFNHLIKRYQGGKSFGLELYRGTKVENQLKKYVTQTNHEIGELRTKLSLLSDDLEKSTVLGDITKKEAEKAKKEIELKQEQDRRLNEKKDLWKSKGLKDNPNIFHDDNKKIKIKR